MAAHARARLSDPSRGIRGSRSGGLAASAKLCIGKFDAHGPTLPLIPEARSIRAPHRDEPRIGRSRRGGWVTRASCAPRLTTTQCSTPNGKPVLLTWGDGGSELEGVSDLRFRASVKRSCLASINSITLALKMTLQRRRGNMPRPVRRIVTTNDKNGKSEVLLDGPATNSIASILTELWVTDGRAANHGDRFDHATKSTSLEPPPGGTVFRFFHLPPLSAFEALTDGQRRQFVAQAFATMNASHS